MWSRSIFVAVLCVNAIAFADGNPGSTAHVVLPAAFRTTSVDEMLNGCGDAGCADGSGEAADCDPRSCRWLRFDSDATSVLGDNNRVDKVGNWIFGFKKDWKVPVSIGGWHWWNIDTAGVGNGGYGAKGFHGTYAYYTIVNPTYELDNGRTIGANVFFAGRDGQPYRTYYSSKFWFLEGYASISDPELGTLKSGLVFTKFGLGNYLGFFGTAPYFDGFIQDPDYGFSWEKTSQPKDNVTVDSSLQFFLHDGQWNGGLLNQNSESVAGIHERNTLVARVAPKITLGEGETLAFGVSGMVGEISSVVPGFAGGTRSVWGTHIDYIKGPLNLRGEVLQINGPIVPTQFNSGGPSNRLLSYSTEAAYTIGPVKYRTMFSQSHADNPNGRQTIWSAGTVVQITPHVRTFIEYSDWTVDGHATLGSVPVIQGVQAVIHWYY